MRVRVDFNARTAEGLVRLSTQGAKHSLPASARAGDLVELTDGEIRVRARLIEAEEGLLADPDWQTQTEDAEG